MDDLVCFPLTNQQNTDIIVVSLWIKQTYTMYKKVKYMMFTDSVDLYAHFAIPRPEGAVGHLQCWIPENLTVLGHRRRPAVLILPGGAYEHVSTREAEPVALRFAARGYAAFVLQYSCGPHPFPVALREAAMAMKYIRSISDRFALRPDRVAAVGFSAGGHLCGTLGMLYDGAEVADIGTSPEIRPDALGLCYPVAVSWGRTHEGSFRNLTLGDDALRSRLSLEKLARPDMPPVFLWHTRQDASVPCRNSLILAQALEEQNVPFALHIYHRGVHGLSVADETSCLAPEVSWDVPGWVEAMLGFFREFDFRIAEGEGTV